MFYCSSFKSAKLFTGNTCNRDDYFAGETRRRNGNRATKSPIMAASRRLRDLQSWWRSEIPMKTCLHLLQLDKKGPTIWIVLNV
ncbi:hypothetical protein HanRHA438_Chr06g0255581 [Helianthus annuus]|nr:hypothetical protein HanRHA438_Chr06g0255581 [Helianthus annuus]